MIGAKDGAHADRIRLIDLVPNVANYGEHRNADLLCAPRNADDYLASQALAIQLAFAGDHKIRA